jgi:hypothetical protein
MLSYAPLSGLWADNLHSHVAEMLDPVVNRTIGVLSIRASPCRTGVGDVRVVVFCSARRKAVNRWLALARYQNIPACSLSNLNGCAVMDTL